MAASEWWQRAVMIRPRKDRESSQRGGGFSLDLHPNLGGKSDVTAAGHSGGASSGARLFAEEGTWRRRGEDRLMVPPMIA